MTKKILISLLLICFLFSISQSLDLSRYIIIKGNYMRGQLYYRIDNGNGFGNTVYIKSLSRLLSNFWESGYKVISFEYQTVNYFIIILFKEKSQEGEK